MRVVVLGVHKAEAILLVEWYGIQIGIAATKFFYGIGRLQFNET